MIEPTGQHYFFVDQVLYFQNFSIVKIFDILQTQRVAADQEIILNLCWCFKSKIRLNLSQSFPREIYLSSQDLG